LILDAGALVGYERSARRVTSALRIAHAARTPLVTSAMIVAQAWREANGRQAVLARLLRLVEVHDVEQATARAAGVLLGRSGTSDAVDAVLVLLARDGDQILTSDPRDIGRLVTTLGRDVTIVPC